MRGTIGSGCAKDAEGTEVDCGYDELFSFADMGQYDIPAFVDKITYQTGH
jgi:hypothetical protein